MAEIYYNTTEELFEDAAYLGLQEVIRATTEKLEEMREDMTWLKEIVTRSIIKKHGEIGNAWQSFDHGWYSSKTKSFEWLCSSSQYFYLTRGSENANSLLLQKPDLYSSLMDLTVRILQYSRHLKLVKLR